MNPLFTLFKPLTDIGKQWMVNSAAKGQAKHEKAMAIEQRKTDLIVGESSHNHSWELAALSDRDGGAKQARWFFIIFYTIPVVYTCIDPIGADDIWFSLGSVPNWIVGVIVTMTGWAFAAKPLQNVGAGMVGSTINFKRNNSSE